MAINKTALQDYVNENTNELLIKSMLGAKTLNYVEIMTNVKYKSALNYLDSTAVFADGSECGFDAEGTDVLTQRTIEVKPIKVNKEWCDRDLLSTWMNHENLIAAGREKLPYVEKFVDANLRSIENNLEKLIWQGDTSIGIDGFIDILGDESGVIDVTGTDVETLIDNVYAAIPEAVMDKDVHIFVSPSLFRNYVKGMNGTCCANRDIVDAAAGEMTYVGDSRVKIVAVGGLEGLNVAVAGARDNFVYGTDVEDAHAMFKLWYSDDDDLFRFKVLFNAGVQIKFPSDAVYGTIAEETTPDPTPDPSTGDASTGE